MGGGDCFAPLAMTSPVIGIWEGSETEISKRYGHCEDPPVGGDEAISWVSTAINKLDLIVYRYYGATHLLQP
jgi:hypothetical protein